MSSRRSPGGEISEAARAWLEANGREVAVPAASTVVRRGEAGRAFFLVVAGELEVRLGDEGQPSLALARLGPGSFFGEMALLRSEPVSADVVALS